MSKVPQVGGNSNKRIRDAIQKIALHGLYNSDKGTFYSTERKLGYVTAIYLEGEYAGTIDVMEYDSSTNGSDGNGTPLKHEHVWLSAIQNSLSGYVVVPKLYSDVIIYYDPIVGEEFVVMASIVDVINIQSDKEVFIGFKERKPYNPATAGDDDTLAGAGLTENSSSTIYNKDGIINTVTDGKNSTTETIDKDKFTVKHGSKEVIVNDQGVYLGSDRDTSHAVLGEELCDVLEEIVRTISQIKTTTSLGPQPVINMVSFLTINQKLKAFKTNVNGFLSKDVMIKK